MIARLTGISRSLLIDVRPSITSASLRKSVLTINTGYFSTSRRIFGSREWSFLFRDKAISSTSTGDWLSIDEVSIKGYRLESQHAKDPVTTEGMTPHGGQSDLLLSVNTTLAG